MQKRPGVPWSVKGIDDDARQSAKLAAREAGMTLGEWLTNMIKENANEDRAPERTVHPAVEQSMRGFTGGARSGGSRDDDISRRLDSLAGQLSMLSDNKPRPRVAAARYAEPPRSHAQDTVIVQSLIDRIEASERASASAIDQLAARLDHVADRVSQPAPQNAMPQKPEDVPGFNALETAMRNIVDHIEASELSTRDTLKSIQQRMGEMANRAAQAASEQLNQNAPALTSLEQRISDMNARLENSRVESSREMQQYVQGQVNQLSERIDAVRHSTDAIVGQAQAVAVQAAQQESQQLEQRLSGIIKDLQARQGVDPDVKRIYADIETINRRLDQVSSEAASSHDIQSIRDTLNGLSSGLSHAQDMPQQIAQLSHRIDSIDTVDMSPQLSELERRVQAMDEQLRQAAGNPADPASAARFSDQLNSVADRLSATENKLNHLATIEQAIEQLYRSAEETRNWAGQAAEDAAQRAVQQFAGGSIGEAGSGHVPSAELQALESGLSAVKASAEQADQRTQETLEAVHDTLEQIIEKLAQLENRAPQPATAFAEPAPAPQPEYQAAPCQPDTAAEAPMTAFDVEEAFAPIHRQTSESQGNDDIFAQQVSFDQGVQQSEYVSEPELQAEPADSTPDEQPGFDMGVPDPDAVEQARHEPSSSNADSLASEPAVAAPGVQEDFIAAARRAAQNASSQRSSILGSIGGLTAGPLAAPSRDDDDDEKPKSRFSLPFRRKSSKVEADEETAVEADDEAEFEGDEQAGSGSRRKYLIFAGIMLLAAVSAFAIGGGKSLFSSNEPVAKPALTGTKTSALERPADDMPALAPAATVAQVTTRANSQTAATLLQQPVSPTASGTADAVEPLPAPEVVTASLPAAADAENATLDTAAASVSQQPLANATDAGSLLQSAETLPEAIGPASLRSAAAGGNPNAQFVVASRFLDGKTVPQDFDQAAEWYRKAAAQGLAPAQYRLGTLYERGHGVTKNPATARQWYESAAANNNVKAMHNLAVIYASSDSGEPRFDQAAKWFEAAAGHGLKDSLYNLAVLYERGLGVEQDSKKAYYWFGIAARHGDAGAKAKVESLKSFLTAEQRKQVDANIASWKPRQPEAAGNFVSINDPSWQVAVTAPAAPGSTGSQFDAMSEPELILKAQQMLSAMGYDVGPLDGVMGTRTANAVRLFQLQTGMAVNGTVSPELVSRLAGRAS